eukprot:g6884.t1
MHGARCTCKQKYTFQRQKPRFPHYGSAQDLCQVLESLCHRSCWYFRKYLCHTRGRLRILLDKYVLQGCGNSLRAHFPITFPKNCGWRNFPLSHCAIRFVDSFQKSFCATPETDLTFCSTNTFCKTVAAQLSDNFPKLWSAHYVLHAYCKLNDLSEKQVVQQDPGISDGIFNDVQRHSPPWPQAIVERQISKKLCSWSTKLREMDGQRNSQKFVTRSV